MNIIVFCAYFHPHEGGVERYVEGLFHGLKGINTTIVTANTEKSRHYETWKRFKIYRYECWHILNKTYPIIKPSEIRRIAMLFEENKYDYLITNTRFFQPTLVGARLAVKYDIPLIHFEHGTEHTPLKNPVLRFLALLYDHTFGRYVIEKSYKTVGISKASEKFVRHLFKRDTELIHNSIDANGFSKIDAKEINSIKIKLGISDEKIIIFIGRLIYAKGVQDLINATKKIPSIKLIIIGDGNYRKYLERMSDNTIFLGSLKTPDICRYLSIADIFVNPSHAEGLPTSILEAGAMALPVIATDVGGTREIITDGKNGYLIRPKDVTELRRKILDLISDNKKRKSMGKTLQEKIFREFDWKTAKKKITGVLR